MLTTNGVRLLRALYRRKVWKTGLDYNELMAAGKFDSETDLVLCMEEMVQDRLIFKTDTGHYRITGVGEVALKHENIYNRGYAVAIAACIASLCSLVLSILTFCLAL